VRVADCHAHILLPSLFPFASPQADDPPERDTDSYLEAVTPLRVRKSVFVTPSRYHADNRATAAAIARVGRSHSRGVAAVNETSRLDDLSAQGMVAARFNLASPGGAGSIEALRTLADRVADVGWHVEVHARPPFWSEHEIALSTLSVPLVIDHVGRVPGDRNPGSDPDIAALLRLLDRGNTWVKVSGVCHDSSSGPPQYSDRAALARAVIRYAPERAVWGSDWPHVSSLRVGSNPPREIDLLTAPLQGIPESTRKLVLWTNARKLYGF